MHGNKSQNQRDRVLAAFRSGILISRTSQRPTFTGSARTARAGADGIAISLCDAEEVALVRDIEKLIRMSILATDQRTKPRHAQPSAAQGRGRPIIRAPSPRRKRDVPLSGF
jgi:ATP-dependent RNA helicase RhlE